MTRLTLLFLVLAAEPTYQHIDDIDGVSIETREVPNSKFLEYRYQTTTTRNLEALCANAYGDGKITSWEKGNISARKVLEEKPDEKVTYDRVESPIMANRDYAIRVVRTREPNGTCNLTIASAANMAPKLDSGWLGMDKIWGAGGSSPRTARCSSPM